MERREPHFTVIIPTRNRAVYLAETLKTCSLQDYDRLEVLVVDDGSTEDNEQVVAAASRLDSRIKFLRNGFEPGMRGNFEFALGQVKPGYVIALGGDDGLIPGGISDMRDVLDDTGAQLLTWPAPTYSYPGTRSPRGQLSLYRSRGVRLVESQTYLARQAKRLNYLVDVETPMFYVKGVVSTRLIDAVRDRSPGGRFYACATPDGYSGIVLAGETPRFAFSGRPFAIHGISPDSQGQAYQRAGAEATQLSQRFFANTASTPMHSELASAPYSPLITLMTADYLLTARDLPRWSGQIPRLDFRQILRKGLQELAHAMYSEERIAREVDILRRIASHHGLADFLTHELRRVRRQSPRPFFQGTGLNASALFFDAQEYGLKTIVDAAYAARTLHRVYVDAVSGGVARALMNSLGYGLQKIRRADRIVVSPS